MKSHHALILAAFSAVATPAFAQSNANRVAIVNGQTITQQDLDRAAGNDLRNLETKRLQNDATLAQDKQQILTRALEQLAADKLIEAEAKKLNMSKEQLLDAEVNIVTSMGYPTEIFQVTNDITEHWEQFSPIVSHRFPFADVQQALRTPSTPGAVDKVVVKFQ